MMITYLAGQFLLVQGYLLFLEPLFPAFLNISGNFGNAVGNPRPHPEKGITDVIDPPFADRFEVT